MLKFAKTFGMDLKKKFKWVFNTVFSGKQPNTPYPIGPEGITVKDALTVFIDL